MKSLTETARMLSQAIARSLGSIDSRVRRTKTRQRVTKRAMKTTTTTTMITMTTMMIMVRRRWKRRRRRRRERATMSERDRTSHPCGTARVDAE